MDQLGDDIATDPHTDKRKPHVAVLRVWHAAMQASATAHPGGGTRGPSAGWIRPVRSPVCA